MRTRQERKTQIHRVGIIAEQDVDCVFDDGRIRSMAAAHKLPSGTDLPRLGAAVRDAARIYAREAQIPNRNELHDEISTLYRLADKKQFVQLAAALEGLSSEVRELLTSRCIGELPSSQVLRCIELRDAACQAIVSLCCYGGSIVPGRRRPGGKRSRSHFEPLLYAPERSSHFKKRSAERNFVMWLRVAYLEAVGKSPPRMARHIDRRPTTLGELAKARRRRRARHTTLGPFASFAKECLKLAGACADLSVVELINSLATPQEK